MSKKRNKCSYDEILGAYPAYMIVNKTPFDKVNCIEDTGERLRSSETWHLLAINLHWTPTGYVLCPHVTSRLGVSHYYS